MSSSKKDAVLITAATKRLGFELTKKSLEMGLNVIAHYRSDSTTLKNWLACHEKYKDKVFEIQTDLSTKPEILIDKSLNFPVTLIGLINNASIFTGGNLNNVHHFYDCLHINFTVPLLLSHHFTQRIHEGWIINITDADIKKMNCTYQNYRISKIFLSEITTQMAYIFGPKIRVNALAPGALIQSDSKDETYFTQVKKKVPLKSSTKMRSFTKAYAYLVDNHDVTGQTLYVDSGLHLLS